MSWSVSANGKVADVKAMLDTQFAAPLAPAPAGLEDEGERETVRQVQAMMHQCLDTFDPEKTVMAMANGHMGFDNWEQKSGVSQTINVSIHP